MEEGKKTVWVIDDHDPIHYSIKINLKTDKYNFVKFHSENAAIAELDAIDKGLGKAPSPDVIIADYGAKGSEIAGEKIVGIAKHKDIPVIIISRYEMEEQAKAMKVPFVLKPLGAAEIKGAVEKILYPNIAPANTAIRVPKAREITARDKKSILIIDDDKSVRTSLNNILGYDAYNCDTPATNPNAEAIDKLTALKNNSAMRRPDLIILDYGTSANIMPLAKELGIPVFMVSGKGLTETEAKKMGAVGFSLKPLDVSIMDKVKEILPPGNDITSSRGR